MIVLGIDPGFAAFGWSLIRYSKCGSRELVDIGLISTEKSQLKVKVADDNLRRIREIDTALRAIQDPQEGPVLGKNGCGWLVCAEGPSFGMRNAGTQAKISLSWGTLLSLANGGDIPILTNTPTDIKKRTTGAGTASKIEVEHAVIHQYGFLSLDAELRARKLHAKKNRNHIVDSIAACISAERMEMFLVMRKMSP